ncbi:MAG: hypothetical protein V1798_10995 [Pseudomonadota bacterium]
MRIFLAIFLAVFLILPGSGRAKGRDTVMIVAGTGMVLLIGLLVYAAVRSTPKPEVKEEANAGPKAYRPEDFGYLNSDPFRRTSIPTKGQP